MGKNNKPWDIEKQNYVIQEYQKGRLTTDIAKELNTFNTSIRRVLMRHNIALISTADRLRKVKTNPFIDLSDKDTQYWLGYLIADGCIDKGRKCIRLFSKDIDVLKSYKRFLNYPVAIRSELQKKYNVVCFNVGFCEHDAYQTLINIGFTPNKSYDFILSNIPITWDLMRGYFDGDGCFYYQKETTKAKRSSSSKICFTSASLIFLEQISSFLTENGITRCGIRKDKTGNWVLTVNRNEDILHFYNNIYHKASYFLQRKYENFGSYYEEIHKSESH
jgi:hypothetical protein